MVSFSTVIYPVGAIASTFWAYFSPKALYDAWCFRRRHKARCRAGVDIIAKPVFSASFRQHFKWARRDLAATMRIQCRYVRSLFYGW